MNTIRGGQESRQVLQLLAEKPAVTVPPTPQPAAITLATRTTEVKSRTSTDAAPQPDNLSLSQLALFYILSGNHIRDETHANQLAETVGKKSGERLLKCYNRWRNTSDRTCIEGRAKLRPFIKNMEAVIPHLTETAKKKAAESEVEGLKRNLAASLD